MRPKRDKRPKEPEIDRRAAWMQWFNEIDRSMERTMPIWYRVVVKGKNDKKSKTC